MIGKKIGKKHFSSLYLAHKFLNITKHSSSCQIFDKRAEKCISVTGRSSFIKLSAALRFMNAMGSDPDIVKLRLDSQWELPVVSDEALMAQYLKVTPPNNKIAVLESMDYAVTPPALEEFG